MRIYVAAPWIDRDRARDVAKQLTEMGHTVTHNWWDHDFPWEDHPNLQKCAQDDVKAVRTADFVLLLNSSKSEGKAVEQGLAIAYNIPIAAVDLGSDSKNVFHHLPNYIWFKSVEEAIERLSSQG